MERRVPEAAVVSSAYHEVEWLTSAWPAPSRIICPARPGRPEAAPRLQVGAAAHDREAVEGRLDDVLAPHEGHACRLWSR